MKKHDRNRACLSEGEIISAEMQQRPNPVSQTENSTPQSESEMLLEGGKKSAPRFVGWLKRVFKRYFIDAFTGMAQGLFVTLIAGTIVCQIAGWIGTGNQFGYYLNTIGSIAKMLMGAGIGVGIAHYWKCNKLVIFAAAVTGLIGAFANQIIDGNLVIKLGAPGNPIGSYIVAVLSVELTQKFVAGRTKVDIVLVPLAMMLASVAGIYVAWPFIKFVDIIGQGIGLATGIAPISMGIIISVSMGLLLTLPTSSAAIWVAIATATASSAAIANGNADPDMLLAGGAAVCGCAAHMVGFAVQSFRENKWGGLIAQGLGTSMLQIPNLMKHPRILIPPVIASVIVGPLATTVMKLYCTSVGGGMGTSGLVGVFGTIEASAYMGLTPAEIGIRITFLMFVIPAVVCFAASEIMRKFKWIKYGDMSIEG